MFSISPFVHICAQKVVPHLLHLQLGRVTISPLPHTTSPFKSSYHGKAKMTSLETFQLNMIKTLPNVTSIVMLIHGFRSAGGGRSGGAMVLGELPVPGRPTIWVIVGWCGDFPDYGIATKK